MVTCPRDLALRVAGVGALPGDRVHLLAAALLDAAEHPFAVVHELRHALVLERLALALGQVNVSTLRRSCSARAAASSTLTSSG
jgi:hypothetical protein